MGAKRIGPLWLLSAEIPEPARKPPNRRLAIGSYWEGVLEPRDKLVGGPDDRDERGGDGGVGDTDHERGPAERGVGGAEQPVMAWAVVLSLLVGRRARVEGEEERGDEAQVGEEVGSRK